MHASHTAIPRAPHPAHTGGNTASITAVNTTAGTLRRGCDTFPCRPVLFSETDTPLVFFSETDIPCRCG
jgi:hypothetical protein